MEGCRDGAAGGHLPPGWCGAWCTTQSSPEPDRDTGYMVHPPGGMVEVGKGSQHQLRIDFWSFRHVVQGFRQQLLFEMTLLMLRGPCFHADGT